jgi:hypothetical protein
MNYTPAEAWLILVVFMAGIVGLLLLIKIVFLIMGKDET